MSGFRFDSWAALKMQSAGAPPPNPANAPNRQQQTGLGLGALGGLGGGRPSPRKIEADPAALLTAAQHGAVAVAAGPADDIEAAEAEAIRELAEQPAPEPPERHRELIRPFLMAARGASPHSREHSVSKFEPGPDPRRNPGRRKTKARKDVEALARLARVHTTAAIAALARIVEHGEMEIAVVKAAGVVSKRP